MSFAATGKQTNVYSSTVVLLFASNREMLHQESLHGSRLYALLHEPWILIHNLYVVLVVNVICRKKILAFRLMKMQL